MKRFLILALLLLPASLAPALLRAQIAPAPADIQRMVETLRDDTRRAELMRLLEVMAAAQRQAGPAAGHTGVAAAPTGSMPASPTGGTPTSPTGGTPTTTPGAAPAPAPAPPAPAPARAPATAAPSAEAPPAEFLGGASQQIGHALDHLIAGIRSAANLPLIWDRLRDVVTDSAVQSRVLELGWKLLLVFGAGLLAERLATRLLRRWASILDARVPPEHVRHAMLRRAPYIVLRLVLDLVPVVVFGVVAQVAVSLLPGWPSQRIIMWTVASAYLGARGLMVVVRLLFSPASNHLRLLRCADETAAYATVWLRRIALVTVAAYAASEFAVLLVLPPSVRDGLLRAGLLVASIFVCVIVLQNRQTVAQVLAAPALLDGEPPDRSRRLLRTLRDRLADAWHVLAILWVVALWGVWALQLEHGFERLLRASLFTALVILVAKLADEGLRRLLAHAFAITPELARRYPGLEARANRYLPALKGIIGAVFILVAAVILLEIWGLGAFSWFGQGRLGTRVLSAIIAIGLTLLAALVVWEAANTAISRHLTKLSANAVTARSARVRTLLPMLRTALAVVVLVFVGLNVLHEIGVNVAPLLAGAGVIGLAVGFGSQTLVRDVITGIFLLFEDAVAVGDVVTLGGLSGTVEQLSIRSIRLRALDGSIHIVPFSAVTTVTNQTRDYGFAVLDLVVDYEADTDAVGQALQEVGDALSRDEAWAPSILAPIEVMGVDKMTDAGVVIRVRIKTAPTRRWAVARELNRRVKQRCGELGIVINPPSKTVQVMAAGAMG